MATTDLALILDAQRLPHATMTSVLAAMMERAYSQMITVATQRRAIIQEKRHWYVEVSFAFSQAVTTLKPSTLTTPFAQAASAFTLGARLSIPATSTLLRPSTTALVSLNVQDAWILWPVTTIRLQRPANLVCV